MKNAKTNHKTQRAGEQRNAMIGAVALFAAGALAGVFLVKTFWSAPAVPPGGDLSPAGSDLPVAGGAPTSDEPEKQTLQGIVLEVKADRLLIQAPQFEGGKNVGPKAALLVSSETELVALVPKSGAELSSSRPKADPRLGGEPAPLADAADPYERIELALKDFAKDDLVEFVISEPISDGAEVRPESVTWIASVSGISPSGLVSLSTENRFGSGSGTSAPPGGDDAPSPADPR